MSVAADSDFGRADGRGLGVQVEAYLQPFCSLVDHAIQSGSGKDWFVPFITKLHDALIARDYDSTQLAIINLFLHEQLGTVLTDSLRQFLIASFQDDDEEDDEEGGDSMIVSPAITEDLQILLPLIRRLGWTVVHRSTIVAALIQLIYRKIKSISCGEYDTPAAPVIDSWLQRRLYPYAATLFAELSGLSAGPVAAMNGDDSTVRVFASVKRELIDNAVRSLAFCRAEELFDIVAEYPDSMTALEELHDCITLYSDIVGRVGKTFRAILTRRLLHMGASTSQILDFYISLVKAMRTLDPSDMLLNFVATPVRSYLKSRKDAVRCIVSALTEGRDSELHSELKTGGSLAYGADEDDEEKGPGTFWEPQRKNRELAQGVDAAAGTNGEIGGSAGGTGAGIGGESRGLDTLALLVSIYGSTDLFIVEYRSLLADKLLTSTSTSYATDTEVANLELLKIRFGEDSLHSCEVMLKDIEDSKRVNNAIQKKLEQSNIADSDAGEVPAVDYTIISDKYWPSVPMDPVKYHPHIEAMLRPFNDTFCDLKKPRKLHPAMQLGQVEIDLEFLGGAVVRSFIVTPLQASVIMFFSEDNKDEDADADRPIRSLEQLAVFSEIDEEDVVYRSGVMYWISKGVLKEIADPNPSAAAAERYNAMGDVLGPNRFFQMIEEEAQLRYASADESMESDGGNIMGQESFMNLAADMQQRAAMAQIEGYVKGLLSSHGTMNLERLHTMLKLLSGGGGVTDATSDVHFDMSVPQLRQYLQSLVDQHKIELIDGVYSLCK